MAVVYQTDEEEKKKTGEAQGQGVLAQGNLLGEEPEQELTTGGGDSSMVQGSGGASSAQRQGGSSSGSYTNLQAYLDANRNDDIGGRVTGAIQGEVDQAKQAQATAGQGFKQKVDESRIGTDQSLLDRIKQDARSVTGSEADKTAFQKMRDAQYKGPSSLTETEDLFNPAYKESKEAQDQLQAMKSLEGRKAYLKQQSGPQYSKGMGKLDNLLLQNDPNSRAAFQNLQSQNQGFESDYDKLLSELGDYAGKAKTDTEGTKNAALEALTSGLKAQTGKTDERLKGRLGQLDQADKYRQMLASKDFSGLTDDVGNALADPEQRRGRFRDLFGVDPNEALMDMDPAQFFSQVNRENVTSDTVRNQEEADILKALGDLGGDVSGMNLGTAGLYDDEELFALDRQGFKNTQAEKGAQLRSSIDSGLAPYQEAVSREKREVDQTQSKIAAKQAELQNEKARGGNPDRFKKLQQEIAQLSSYAAQHQAALIMAQNELPKREENIRQNAGYYNKFKF